MSQAQFHFFNLQIKLSSDSTITMAYPLDPMVKTYDMPKQHVSKKLVPVAGIQCAVYGLDELPPQAKEVSCLFALHARGVTMASMEHIAVAAVADYNRRLREGRVEPGQQNKGMIAVCFDQRNHGTREVDRRCNNAWRNGNPTHAQDMWAIFRELSPLFFVLTSSEVKLTWTLQRALLVTFQL